MIGSRRIRLKPLAQLCRRLAIATAAGLEDRRIWRDEATRGGASQRAAIQRVSEELGRGESIVDALGVNGDFFPPLFKQMVVVGEMSGRLELTYRRLAEYYEHALNARRAFWGRMAWPAFQFAIALLVIAVMILVAGLVATKDASGLPMFDPLGFGLTGKKGLIVYLNALIFMTIAALLIVDSFSRQAAWTRTLGRAALRLPLVGPPLQTLALARFTWALQLVSDTPMDLRKALPLALDATDNEFYSKHGPDVARNIGAGMTLHAALAATYAFPMELLDAVAVAEQSGSLVETMRRQADDYQVRAAAALSLLAQLLGYALWALVAAMIIVLIFRIFSFYVGTINELSKPGGGGF